MARILVIDDERIIRTIVKHALEEDGHEVIEAGDGEEGIQLYRKNPTDLVVTDIIMPRKEGIETIKELRRNYPDIKIIAMSGGGKISSVDYLKLARQFGAMGTYDKSSNWGELVKMVRELLSAHSE
jgi:DNA-binding NtrC family response regulator